MSRGRVHTASVGAPDLDRRREEKRDQQEDPHGFGDGTEEDDVVAGMVDRVKARIAGLLASGRGRHTALRLLGEGGAS